MKDKQKAGEQIVYGVVKISEKGQIIIPVELRKETGLKAGDQLVVTKSRDGEGILLLPIKVLDEMLASSKYYYT